MTTGKTIATLAALLAIILAAALAGSRMLKPGALVVYCAHDAEYATDVLRRFEKQTGIPVVIHYDTEATKSLGLVEKLIAEKQHPRCDVFWNNQVIGTLELQELGITQPYKGPGYDRIPEGMKDPGGHWAGFAARMRVYIVNTNKMEATEAAIAKALEGNLSRVAIAKPLFGTTCTQYAALWHDSGPEMLKAWHTDCRRRGICEAGGNAQTKNLVAEGVCDLGYTDSDDYYVARDEGKPVAALPVRYGPQRQALVIPNTVCIIKGTPRLKTARKLADYLLSAESELALANSGARQIPLGPVDEAQLPAEVKELRRWADGAVMPATNDLVKAYRDCLNWLKTEYAP